MRRVLLLLFCLPFFGAQAQPGDAPPFFRQKVAAYQRAIATAPNDSVKVDALGRLAAFYFIYRAEKQADSILQQQLQLAEVSNNKNLVLNALFGNALTNIEGWAKTEPFDRALLFAEKGLA